ncbi:hypothetical protein P4S63_15155 [Pseudoalteromonas sp. B193]
MQYRLLSGMYETLFLPLILPFSHTAFADNQNNDAIETITTTASRIEALSTPPFINKYTPAKRS